MISTITRSRSHFVKISHRVFSDWGKGQDLLGDSLDWGDKPKVVLDGYSPSGFDVINIIEKMDEDEESDSGGVHMAGSIMAFPSGCFLWNIRTIEDVTMESLAPAILHRPKLDYLFLGSDQPMDPEKLYHIKMELREKADIVVEQLDVGNAMGTFNILNGEDRPIAAALVLLEEKFDDDNIVDETTKK